LQRRKDKNDLKGAAKSFEPGAVLGGQLAPPILQKYKDESAYVRYAEVWEDMNGYYNNETDAVKFLLQFYCVLKPYCLQYIL